MAYRRLKRWLYRGNRGLELSACATHIWSMEAELDGRSFSGARRRGDLDLPSARLRDPVQAELHAPGVEHYDSSESSGVWTRRKAMTSS